MTHEKILEINAIDFLNRENFEVLREKIFDPELGYNVEDFSESDKNLIKYITSVREKGTIVLEILKEGFIDADKNKVIMYPEMIAVENNQSESVTMRIMLDDGDNTQIGAMDVKKLVFWDSTLIQAIY